MKYWKSAHTKHRLMYHIVWIPKYRKRILNGKLAARLEELFKECAEVNCWSIEELNIQVDHIHMILQIKPNISISKMVQLFKGGSSKTLREEFPDLKEFLWGKNFWAEGYFVETVGKCEEKVIREYVKNQM